MNDQVLHLTDIGVKSVHQTATASHDESSSLKKRIIAGDFQFIYTTPELLLTNKDRANVFRNPSFNERLHCI